MRTKGSYCISSTMEVLNGQLFRVELNEYATNIHHPQYLNGYKTIPTSFWATDNWCFVATSSASIRRI